MQKKFAEFLGERKWSNEVRVDPQTETLSILVDSKGGAMGSDLRALSGGERSFVTLAFAFAAASGNDSHPFRCFDEFDVYMVRSIVRRLIVEWPALRVPIRTSFARNPDLPIPLPAGRPACRTPRIGKGASSCSSSTRK